MFYVVKKSSPYMLVLHLFKNDVTEHFLVFAEAAKFILNTQNNRYGTLVDLPTSSKQEEKPQGDNAIKTYIYYILLSFFCQRARMKEA